MRNYAESSSARAKTEEMSEARDQKREKLSEWAAGAGSAVCG